MKKMKVYKLIVITMGGQKFLDLQRPGPVDLLDPRSTSGGRLLKVGTLPEILAAARQHFGADIGPDILDLAVGLR